MSGYENNTNSLKHGGASARKAITTDDDFTGPAKVAEMAVTDELEVNGRLSVVQRAAIRLQAASDLYWAALCDAGARNDHKKLTSYTKTFGWLQSKALAAWHQLKIEQGDQPNALDYEMMLHNDEDQ